MTRKKSPITIYIPTTLLKNFKIACIVRGKTVNEEIEFFMERVIRKWKEKGLRSVKRNAPGRKSYSGEKKDTWRSDMTLEEYLEANKPSVSDLANIHMPNGEFTIEQVAAYQLAYWKEKKTMEYWERKG